ncbi:MAG: FmdB family transcriptional regulator [Actinomycetota bacterium]|nr:FmdB family transcriptional regulator [Actinomycetota bacterium]
MPTYVYKFIDSGETIEIYQAFSDDALTEAPHPSDGKPRPVKKVFTPVGITFKGGGFYKTDSATSGKTAASATSAGSSTSSSTGSTTSSTTDTSGGATSGSATEASTGKSSDSSTSGGSDSSSSTTTAAPATKTETKSAPVK